MIKREHCDSELRHLRMDWKLGVTFSPFFSSKDQLSFCHCECCNCHIITSYCTTVCLCKCQERMENYIFKVINQIYSLHRGKQRASLLVVGVSIKQGIGLSYLTHRWFEQLLCSAVIYMSTSVQYRQKMFKKTTTFFSCGQIVKWATQQLHSSSTHLMLLLAMRFTLKAMHRKQENTS